ncbi:acidic leucine-rich nuclear phosphoprotein 32 family member A isoform X1 [Malaya genurostris]|uniref:acidic leucine-rich nuclear phosphoprotein 32 family member A isoform X1 n=1 Tax=Malaya genurostris TaxID=325434 RepID=UPI0026F3A308|nr:acidic leucine-rich nuclear phosphoprotein 32 family member A isoform X1 [Malaya genurostris]
MEKRIALEKRGRPDEQITELILDNCRSTNIEGLTDSFKALEVLSLINVGLVSLKSFPKLPNLRKLELSDNRISNGLSNLTGSPKLTHLNLSGNRIKDFDELKPLKELENLEVLDLFNNEVTTTDDYRDKIFELIPSLKYLDGFDKEDTEAPSDEEDEVNGGLEEEEDEEDNACFSINGIEFDLDELERFESRLREKRSKDQTTANRQVVNGLECQFDRMELNPSDGENVTVPKSEIKDDIDLLYEEIQQKNDQQHVERSVDRSSLGSLLLAFLSLLAFINQICYALRSQQPIEQDLDSSDYDEDEENDISLAEVYNENLEEDGSDWNEEDGEVDDDIDEPTDEDEDDGEGEDETEGQATGGKVVSDAEADDSAEARGKKRKHDGNDG